MDGSAAFDLEKHDIIKLRTFVAGLKPLLTQRWYSESTEPKNADTTGITEKNKTRKTADLVSLAAVRLLHPVFLLLCDQLQKRMVYD